VTTETGAPAVAVVLDVLGRPLTRAQIGFDGTPNVTRTVCTARGEIAQVSRPASYAATSQYWTSFAYDGLGRVQTETAPDGAITTTSYGPLTVTATDALGHASRKDFDARCNVLATVDALGTLTN
jgi:YD repeat-containing protein